MEVEKAVNPRFRVYRHLFPNGKSYVGITSATPVSARWKNGKAISEASVGKPGTFTGKTHSEETIRKMSEARRAYWEKKRGGAV